MKLSARTRHECLVAAATACASQRCSGSRWTSGLHAAAGNNQQPVMVQQQQHEEQQEEEQQQQTAQQPQPAAQQQQPLSLTDLLGTHGARLTTAAQMVWSQVLQPGDTAVDATCGNGHDSLFMAHCIGPSGRLVAIDLQVCVAGIDLQASAVAATRSLLESSMRVGSRPALQLEQACHSNMQQLVGSNVAALVAFNLGYLPGGDKTVITQPNSTLAAMEAALEVVRPGGLISCMAYIGHPGGLEEYEQVKALLSGLPPTYWSSIELRLLNRPSAPVLLLLWRRPDAQQQQPEQRGAR